MAGVEWNWGKCNETGLEDRVGGRPRGLPVDSGHKPMSDSYRMEAKESVKEVYSSHVVTPDEVTYSSHYWEKGLSHTGQALRECGALGTHCTLQLENHGTYTHTHTRAYHPQLVSGVRRTNCTVHLRPRCSCREPAAGRTLGLGGTLLCRSQAGTLRQRHGWSGGDCGLCPA